LQKKKPPLRRGFFLSAILASLCASAQESPPRFPDFGAEKSYAIPAAEIVGFDFLLNRFDNRYFGCCDYRVTSHTVRRNLRSSWGLDRDPFTVNQLGHPYQGSMYHTFARSAGLDYWHGLAYTFIGSAFWEVLGETTPPSRNDQITTGIGGSFLGEALFRMASLVLEKQGLHSSWRELVAAGVSPAAGFNRHAFGNRFRGVFPSHDPAHFTRLQLGFSGTAQDDDEALSRTRLRRNEALGDFYLEYGLPGKKDYEYTRPFDYFAFQATLSSANGFENAMTRGLLKGRTYAEGDALRGIWGVYGSYDYIFPQTFRVSSTALSVGSTAQWQMSDSFILQGTALAGAGYAAVGSTRSAFDGDYHYGLAPQGLAALRLIYKDRAAIDFTAREYFLSKIGAAARGGHENIARVDAALTWRVLGQHGISVKYLGNFRDAHYPDMGGTSQRRATIGIFYTLLGNERFGAVNWR
jgi:hypothetical protein